MLSELEQLLTDENSLQNLRRPLSLGPWSWPPEFGPAFDLACRATGLGGPPSPAPEHVLAVTETPAGGSLWLLVDGPAADAGLGSQAAASWENAICALPRSLPMLWASIGPHRERPGLSYLGGFAARGVVFPEKVVEGPSAGLAFFLLLVSRVLKLECPSDIVASAEIDAAGSLKPVAAVRAKIETIVAVAPRVRRLVVSAAQVSEAQECANGRLGIVGVKTAAEAASSLFPGLAGHLVRVTGAAPRRELVRRFFRLALGGRRELLEWKPVETAAHLALQSWTDDLTAEDRYTLEFTAAVAARHDRNAGQLPLPRPGWLESLSAPVRVTVLAHLVQQAADTGEPRAEDVLAMAIPERPTDVRRGFDRQLRLCGAVARLECLRGDAAGALRMQRALSRIHFENLDHQDVSLPLCEWLRLAGALGEREELEAAERFFEEAAADGAFGAGDRAYLDLARGRSEVQAGRASRAALGGLEQLASDDTAPNHVRLSAGRWAVSCARSLGDGEAARRADEHLARSCAEAGPEARVYAILAELDRALALDDAGRATAAVDQLRERLPGLLSHLAHGCGESGLPRHVARFYPY